jgi:hypothetical protein
MDAVLLRRRVEDLPMRAAAIFGLIVLAMAAPGAAAEENCETWPVLRSTFPSTGGNGIMIKGYDPVITGGKCVTTFMAVEPGADPNVYPNFIEFEAVATQGGTLCRNGKWRAFDGGGSGTTPYRVFFKNGVFRGSP